MSFTYTSLIGDKTTPDSIRNWMNNDKIPSTTILSMAQDFIYRLAQLMVRDMISDPLNGDMVQDQDWITVPERFLQPISFQYRGKDKDHYGVRPNLPEEVERAIPYDDDGNPLPQKPKFYYATATRLQFEAPALEAYPYRIIYYKRPEDLSPTNETNFLTDEFSHILLSACLWAGNEYMKDDEEKADWERKCRAYVFAANAEYDAQRGRLQVVEIHAD